MCTIQTFLLVLEGSSETNKVKNALINIYTVNDSVSSCDTYKLNNEDIVMINLL